MTATPTTRRRGATLIETLVVMALLGVLLAIVGFSIPHATTQPDDFTRSALDARRQAIMRRIPVSRSWYRAGRSMHITAFPGGLVLADSGRGTFVVAEGLDDGAR